MGVPRLAIRTPLAAPATATSVLRDDGDGTARPVFSTTRVAKPVPARPKVVAKAKGR